MSNVIVYTTKICPYCVRAKSLLKEKNIPFEEIDVSDDPDLRLKMVEKAGGKRTVPQIFINDQSIGGFDDLYALDKRNELESLLKGKS